MGIMQGAQLPQWMFQEEGFKLQLMDQLANWNNALGGQSDRTNESGIHYGRKVLEGLINHTISTETLAQHEKDKAEDGLIMGIQLYGGRTREEKIANYNRRFNGSDGEETQVNIYRGTDDNGEDVVDNDISKLRRVDVIISRSKENDFQKSAKMEQDSSMLQSIQPTPDNALARAAILSDYLRSQPAEDDIQRKVFNEAADKGYEIAVLNAQVMIKGLQAQLNPQPQPQQGQPGQPGTPQTGGGGGSPMNLPANPGAPTIAPGRAPIQNQSALPAIPGREQSSTNSAPQGQE
jgi:hypothetical protein